VNPATTSPGTVLKRTVDIGNRAKLKPWQELLMPVVFCAVFLGQLLMSVGHLSQTADEATHLYSGYRYLRCGDLSISPEHPPLAKVVAVLPLLFMHFDIDCGPPKGDDVAQARTSLSWLYGQRWQAALSHARIAVSVFSIALCLLVWMTARRMFDLATAAIATALLVFEPNFLAYGALVMTDVSIASMLLLSVLTFYLWTKNRKMTLLLLTAAAAGLTLLAKASGVVVLPILALLAVGDVLIQRADLRSSLQLAIRNVLAVVLICVLAFGLVWMGYGVRYAASPGGAKVENVPGDAGFTTRLHFAMKRYRLLPEAYLDGFAGARAISGKSDTPLFVAGRIYQRPPWFLTPFYLVIRSTSATLALFLIAAFGAVIAFWESPRAWLFVLGPATVYLAACARSSLLGGVRYLLPAIPFLLISIAAGCIALVRRERWMGYVVLGLLLLHALSSLRSYPDYLSYANEFWGGPANGYKNLAFLDSGQSYIEAKNYLNSHPSAECWFFTPWQWSPQLYGVHCNVFGLYLDGSMPPSIHGTVILSSNLFTYLRPVHTELAAPFASIQPKAKIGGSALLVYEGDFDTSFAAAWSESQMMNDDLSAGRIADALTHGERSIELAPNSVVTHYAFCTALTQAGQENSALKECSTAQAIANSDPFRKDPVYNEIRIAIENQLRRIRA
jgi:Dolichyl-phosphate-mannose-protein mannosyltransferase